MGFATVASGAALGGCTSDTRAKAGKSVKTSGSASPGSLVFDAGTYQKKTTTISTDDGDKKVTYRFYGPLTNVHNRLLTSGNVR